MHSVLGQYYLDCRINGRRYPFTASHINSLEINENYKNLVPTLALSFFDMSGTLIRENPLTDGSLVDVLVGKDLHKEDLNHTTFRCYGSPAVAQSPRGAYIEMQGMFDRYKYLFGISDKAYFNTSEGAIGQIGSLCNLKFNGHSTNDQQVWLPEMISFANHATQIAKHGYAGSTSAMVLGVTEDAELRYKDMARLASQGGGKKFFYGVGDGIRAIDWKVLPSGFSNAQQGYGSLVYQEQLLGGIGSFFGNIATRIGGFIGVSKGITDAIGGVVNIISHPMDIGNTHEKYAEALQQNARLQSLYSTRIGILIEDVSDVHIFDVCNLQLYDLARRSYNEAYSGSYVVDAKTRFLKQGQYGELITMSSMGPNVNPNGDYR